MSTNVIRNYSPGKPHICIMVHSNPCYMVSMVYSCSFRNIVLEKVLNVSMLQTEILKVLLLWT